jgi:hypothetical protein
VRMPKEKIPERINISVMDKRTECLWFCSGFAIFLLTLNLN